jgi:putative membrane protein insertion efficiency factor
MKLLLIAPIKLYQLVVAPWMPNCCRFSPSCSHYAVGALQRHGALRGSWLAVRRILRCQPFCEPGWDPVPEPRAAERQPNEAVRVSHDRAGVAVGAE